MLGINTNKSLYTILEICDNGIPKSTLLEKERNFIQSVNADLNLKKDPTTEKNCITVIKPVYQFDLFGDFIKKWDSITEAAEFYNIDNSNIIHVCSGDQHQTKNFLWSYTKELSIPPIGLYVYDLSGKLLSKCNNTIDIYETFFSNLDRKTVLSSLKKKINSNSPYKNIFISTDKNFKIPNKNYWYKEKNDLINLFNSDPIIIKYDFFHNVLSKKKLSELKGNARIKKDIIAHPNKYFIDENTISFIHRSESIKPLFAIDLTTNEVQEFKSIAELVDSLYNSDYSLVSNIYKHLRRKTPYKGYLISRNPFGNSIKSSELLEPLEGVKTETELETVDGKV